jgi:hypothetical protein
MVSTYEGEIILTAVTFAIIAVLAYFIIKKRYSKNLKKFLRPDCRKIITFVIILLIFPLFDFWLNYPCERGSINGFEFCKIRLIWDYPDCSLISLLWYQDEFCNVNNVYPNIADEPFYFIYLLVLFYILSCLLIWIYDNRKKVDFRKIILILFFLLFGIALNFILSQMFYCTPVNLNYCSEYEYGNLTMSVFIALNFPAFLYKFLNFGWSVYFTNITWINILIINTFYWYLLSYIIIWIYDKFRKATNK